MSECRPSGRKRKTAGARRRIACLAAACCLAAGGGGASRPARAASLSVLPAPPVAAAVREHPSPLPWRAAGGGDRGYDVTRYDLDLRVDPGERSVAGRVIVALTLAASHPDTLWFDLVDSLVVDMLRWDDAPLPFARGAETVRFVPPTGTAPGDHTVTVVYHGHPPPHGPFRAGLMFRHQGTTPDDPGPPAVAAVSEPVSAHSWWPCRDEPADKARVTLVLTVPDTLQTVAGGRLVASSPAAPGWRRDVWRLNDPVSTYLVSLQVSRYVTWTDTCRAAAGGLPLRFHVFPPDTVTARRILAPTAAMLRFLESVAGPYPFPDDGYGQVTIVWGGAMEHQTCSSLGRFVVAAPDDRFLSVVLHEMAHQWFGDSVTPARWSDIWLNEGFATYAEALWAEHTGGPAAYRAWLRAIGPERHPGLFAGEGILTDPDPILPNLLVYHKGAWVLHMLRWEMGDAAFFTFLREWAAAPPRRHGTATTADLVAAVSAAAGRDLAPFLAPWLETDAVPQLSWSWQELPANSGELLEVNVTQEQATLFRLPLPVRAWGPWGVRDWRWDVAERTGTQRWPVPGRVDSVRIDPDGRLLLAQGPLPPPAITAGPPYPQPAGADGTLLRFTVHRGGPVTITLHDARGRELGRWPLGELAARPEPYRWHWNGTDGAGRPVPDGVYWLAIRWPDGRRACRVTLLR